MIIRLGGFRQFVLHDLPKHNRCVAAAGCGKGYLEVRPVIVRAGSDGRVCHRKTKRPPCAANLKLAHAANLNAKHFL